MFKRVIKEQIKVPAKIEYLKDLRDFVTRIGGKYGFSDSVINTFKLAVDEASTNIIRHAYRDHDGDIVLRMIVRRNSLTISLIDQGRFFNPEQVKDPDLQRYVAIGKRGGLGIFIMRKLVDEIDYRRTEEGNELRLTKFHNIERKRKFPLPFPKIPGTLQVKYYTISAIIISAIVLGAYFYLFFQSKNKITLSILQRLRATGEVLANNSIDGLLEDDYLVLSREAKIIQQHNSQLVSFAVITDAKGMVKGSTNVEKFSFWKPAHLGRALRQITNDIILIQMEDGRKYYLFSSHVFARGTNKSTVLGKVHILLDKSIVDRQIAQKRWHDLKIALLILLLANVGSILLITFIINPFRKLATWIRQLGQGEIQDEMEIDTSDEIGEIAQAFSEITDKFRKSQKDLAEQERLQQEMQMAQEIQQTLLPTEVPSIEGYEIASYYQAAKEVGGDYFDFVEIDRDRLGVVVADVSGKGVPGSLVMTMIRTTLRTEARGVESAAQVLARVNDFVASDMKKGMFVTLFYVILDSRKRRVSFASAGHNPMILYRSETKKTYYLNPKGFPLGISLEEPELFKRSIEDDTIQLCKGDVLLLYTDGVTEAMNSKRELFGEERLLQAVRTYGHLPAKQFIEKLKEEIMSFTEGQVQYDDITLVVIKEKMSAQEVEFDRAKKAFYDILRGVTMGEACRQANIPLSTFTRKYRYEFEHQGIENFRQEYEKSSVELKHLSIEEQTKIYDVIRQHPEYGPKKISNELNTAKYGFTKISENRIYEELVRKHLNTRELREAYVTRNIHRRRLKPPGTPMLTLDGRVIIEREAMPKISAPGIPGVKEITSPPEAEETSVERKEPEKPLAATLFTTPEPKKPSEQPPESEEEQLPVVETEAEEFVLSDIVDLFGKEKEKQLEKEAAEEIVDREEVTSEETKETESTSSEEVRELLDSILKDVQGAESTVSEAEPAKEEVDFSDLSVSAFTEEMLDKDKEANNGDGEARVEVSEVTTESQSGTEESTKPAESEDEIPVEKIFANLSVKVEDEGLVGVKEVSKDVDNKFDDFLEEVIPSETEIKLEAGIQAEPEKQKLQPPEGAEKVSLKVNVQKKLLLKAMRYYLDHEYDKAIVLFEKIIEKSPENIEALYNLGNAYFRKKEFTRATEAYQKVIAIDPTYLDALENLGVIYANQKNFKKAIEMWKRILELKPDRQDIKENIEKALKSNRH